jgi:hypothetical protein
MNDDQHPADGMVDGIVNAIKGMFNGDDIKQSVRDAWDRIHGPAEAPAQPDPDIQKMNKALNDKPYLDAAESFRKQALTSSAAANIRKAASK